MARRQITPELANAQDLPDITAQQMEFVENIIAGKNASDAYRAAYNTENMQNESIQVAASRLKANANVALWIDAVRAAGFGRVSCTFDEHMTELARLRGVAERSGNIGAAVQAEQLRGKVAGHYVDKVQDVTADDPIATLKDIARTQPELAASLAAENNIPWGADQGATKH